MSSKIKQDINLAGGESTDLPSACESCLPDIPLVQMLKENYGAECKICTRPFTVFSWRANKQARKMRTNICLTCARLKNCCQQCMRDLAFGLPLPIRDAALKLVAPGPTDGINKQYYAQAHERDIEEGKSSALEVYNNTDVLARDLLKKLARSDAYRIRNISQESASSEPKTLPAPVHSGGGPIRQRDMKRRRLGGPRVVYGPNSAPTAEDIRPPADPNMTSLRITGVEDDLPEHKIRSFFAEYGALLSIVVSHRAHAGYINYASRQSAEAAAEACQGKAVIAGCPLRIRWGKPRRLDSMEDGERMNNLNEGRTVYSTPRGQRSITANQAGEDDATAEDDISKLLPQAPPGVEDVEYASLAGN